jgi:hypothetical protein
MSDNPLFDPPKPEGLESLKSAIAHRLSDSFAHFARPSRPAANTLFDPLRPSRHATAHCGSDIPTLSESMVESLTNPSLKAVP